MALETESLAPEENVAPEVEMEASISYVGTPILIAAVVEPSVTLLIFHEA